jgi:hypothetical protein
VHLQLLVLLVTLRVTIKVGYNFSLVKDSEIQNFLGSSSWQYVLQLLLLTLMQLSKRTFAMECIEDHGCCVSSSIVLWLNFNQTTIAVGAFNLSSLMGRYHCISTMVGTVL